MDLKEIMGDAYVEGMTADDVKAYFKKQVLSTGEYESKGKSEAEKRALKDEIEGYKKQIQDKMSDEDKKKAQDLETQKMIEELQKQLAESNKTICRGIAETGLSTVKTRVGIKADDKEFEDFISIISNNDNENTKKVSEYIAKIVESAYECGKNEVIKDKLGKLGGSFKGNSSEDVGEESLGKKLAEMSKPRNQDKKNFFERK